MLTKGKTSKFRAVKYAAMVLALIAVFALCLTACGKAAPVSAEYVTGTLAKGEYNQGDIFDCSGAQIRVTYDNDTTETVNVTPAMVGEVKLNTVGDTNVSVTYSTEGGSVTAIIPVTVLDPLAADRDAALTKINGNANVSANATDKGVQELLATYTGVIKAAGTKTDIDTLVSGFEAKVKEYVDAKADAIARIDGVDLEQLFPQFKLGADSAYKTAIADVKNATTLDAVNDAVETYTNAIENILAEQRFYIENTEHVNPDNIADGQIKDKIDLLTKIDGYVAHLNSMKNDVELYSTSLNKEVYIGEFKAAVGDLEWWYKYIYLATDLGGIEAVIDEIYKKTARTPFDDIYDALKDMVYDVDSDTYTEDILGDGDDITVIPGAYTKDETTGEFVCTTGTDKDTIFVLIEKLGDYYQAYVDKFGRELAEKRIVDHQIFCTTIKIDLNDFVEQLFNVYTDLVAKQTAAEAVVDAIDAIELAADENDKSAAIADAWTALKTWGATNGIFSENADITTYYNNLVFDKTYDGIYKIIETEDASTYELGAYDFTEDYMVKYFVPNFDELLHVTISEDLKEVEKLVAEIPEYIIYATEAEGVDSKGAIDAAAKARQDFIDHYTMAIYEEYAPYTEDADGKLVDELLNTITAARDEYDELVKMATEINDVLVPALNDNASEIVISDYKGENPVLKNAYDKYIEFAKRNDAADGTLYTGVITEEAHLLACVDEYVRKAYIEERTVLAPLSIYATAKIRVDGIDKNETALREGISNLADAKVNALSDAAYDYNETILSAAGVNNINRIDVLDANIEYVETYVTAAEAEINAFQLP